MDLIWGYNNIWIKKGNEWKAAFLTNKGLFEPKVIYFGLCNSPGILANYMYDFVISTRTKKELEKRMIWFLKIAEKHNLCFKWSKCDFDAKGISILEVVVG